MSRIRVIVADDSAFMRKIITDLIESDGTMEVIATARNGEEVVSLAHKHKPDVITLDVEMPEVDGLTALKQLVSGTNIPVIMLSGLTQSGAMITVQALENGAFDFVAKPSGLFSADYKAIQHELTDKIRAAAMARPSIPRYQSSFYKPIAPERKIHQKPASQIIAIGTSTGGPRALQTILTSLPANLPAGIVIVQHMPPGFTKSLALRLNELCHIKVVEAEDSELILEGVAYIAPGGWHMEVKTTTEGVKTALNQKEKRRNHRPSVDNLFESLAIIPSVTKNYCLLTGMGNDGAEGMKHAKEMGAKCTIAEAETTCVVYGMPKSAVNLNCVDYILPLTDIADKLVEMVQR